MAKKFICVECYKLFDTNKGLQNHKCEIRERKKLVNSKQFKVAFFYFKCWVKELKKYKKDKKVTEQQFIESRFFKSFFKFIEFSKKKKIPDNIIFIKMMTEKKILPNIWTKDTVYDIFIQDYDDFTTFEDQIRISKNTIEAFSEKYEIDPSEFLKKIRVNALTNLLFTKNLSLWVLLLSDTFTKRLSTMPQSDKITLSSFINEKKWEKIFTENPNRVGVAKNIVNSLNL